MADQYIERVENLIRVVGSVRDEDFNLSKWCHCAIGHATMDAYFIDRGFNPMLSPPVGHSFMGEIGKFFDVSTARAAELFIPTIGKHETRKDVLAALRSCCLRRWRSKLTTASSPAGRRRTSRNWRTRNNMRGLALATLFLGVSLIDPGADVGDRGVHGLGGYREPGERG